MNILERLFSKKCERCQFENKKVKATHFLVRSGFEQYVCEEHYESAISYYEMCRDIGATLAWVWYPVGKINE